MYKTELNLFCKSQLSKEKLLISMFFQSYFSIPVNIVEMKVVNFSIS